MYSSQFANKQEDLIFQQLGEDVMHGQVQQNSKEPINALQG